MASVITIKIGYEDKSKSLTLSYPAADSDPSAEVIKACEAEALKKWEDAGNSYRGIQINTTVKR